MRIIRNPNITPPNPNKPPAFAGSMNGVTKPQRGAVFWAYRFRVQGLGESMGFKVSKAETLV